MMERDGFRVVGFAFCQGFFFSGMEGETGFRTVRRAYA
jgi:hypothetical protein